MTLWPRMLLFAERGFPGWPAKSIKARAGLSPIDFAVSSGPLSQTGNTHTGENRSVLLFTIWPSPVTGTQRVTHVAQRGRSSVTTYTSEEDNVRRRRL